MATLGFIGLGAMGRPMAEHLADHCAAEGDQLLVWNRSAGRETTVVDRGARVAEGPAELAAACDVVVVMLPDLAQLLELVDGQAEMLSAVERSLVLVVSSSVSPQGVRDFAEHVAQLSDGLVEVVDAPVSGGTEGATDGTLAIMVGGTDEAVARAWPAVTAMGTTVRHLGPLGSGAVAKACNQMVVAATMIALSEASALAESVGVEVAGLLDVLAGGLASSRVLTVKADNLVSRSYAPTGKAVYMVKDLNFVRAEAELSGLPTPQAALSLRLFEDLTEEGLGELDMSVVHQLIRSRAR